MTLLRRYRLNEGSSSQTYHLTFRADLDFVAGDSVAILPLNNEDHVREIASYFTDEFIVDRRTGEKIAVRDYLSYRANIIKIPKKLFKSCWGL